MLVLNNVRKHHGDCVAVDGLSLCVQAGEIYGLLGPNGAGKTTTLSMIAGLLLPDSGRIELADGMSPDNPQARWYLGLAPQSLALYEPLSARENLRFFGRMLGLRGRHLRVAVDDALALAELSERADEPVRQFSGGMKRRLNLAVAMLHKPRLLLLDEPTVGVDPQSRNALLESIRFLRDAGHSIVYTTHYMEEAQKICDRVGIMDHGRLLAEGTVPELIRAYGGDYLVRLQRGEKTSTYRHSHPMELLTDLGFDPDLDIVAIEPPNLESVFLHLTGRHLRDEK